MVEITSFKKLWEAYSGLIKQREKCVEDIEELRKRRSSMLEAPAEILKQMWENVGFEGVNVL